ncbi:hypothetical protein QBC35DRAFT_496054 [Podospora australis]|uniref:Fibronectin type-III domain-containing protein n=1 Tax=Podospora australis TaxID=1536484 RepID=A0AAN6WVN5_9PEZI|nr:hypothetical protein QBC35DRAFT_496054 [Podospora australis]
MSWISWTSLIPTLLIVSASLAWWFTEPKNARINLIAAVGVILFCWAVAPELSRDLSYSLYTSSIDTVAALRIELFIVRHANMLLVAGAVLWLFGRAWQTIRKPVPELINTLGVDVPDPPDVSLAGIRADAATVNWTRPPPNRSVVKFLIQVNGVIVGEVAANQEPAIVVSGLKPDHFYNVRVIAVGSNAFQGGSRVIRLRTFGRDGRPQLGNSRLPSNFTPEEPLIIVQSEQTDENGTPKPPTPGLELPTVPEGITSPVRDGNSVATGSGPRRNTVTRKHSPSTTSIDQATRDELLNAHSTKTLPELTEKFESIRKETEEVMTLIAKEETEHRKVLDELETEKKEKKKEQKKKEEQTEKLRRDVHSTDRSMRNALQRKTQKEKLLKEKQAEHARYHDNIAKWEKQIGDMRRDRESFDQQRRELEDERDQKTESFRGDNADLQAECSRLEQELKERRDQVREMEEARKKLPGGEDDAEWRERDAETKREWHRKHRELSEMLVAEKKRSHELDDRARTLAMQLQHIPQYPYGHGMHSQNNTSSLEFDSPTLTQLKRRSRTINSLSNNSLSSLSISSPLPPYSQVDPALSGPMGFASSRSVNPPPGFAPGPFMMDFSTDTSHSFDDSGFRGSSAPLSPSATALLPSNILDDFGDDDDDIHDQHPTSRFDSEHFPPRHHESPDEIPQSPESLGKPRSVLSSPHGSTSNLPFPPFSNEVSERLIGSLPSPTPDEAPSRKSGFFWQRSKPSKDAAEKEPPLLGSLKQGQSQSFPRQTDDFDPLTNKRRISLSGSWNVLNHRNSVGPEIVEGLPAPASTNSHIFKQVFNPFGRRPTGGLYSDRDPSSPRPTSIASSDFHRPSTESNSISIWGPPADTGKPSRLWPGDGHWSRNPSRRPSIHGSSPALETTLASADDEILDEVTMANVDEVGVIGSRPPTQASKAALARLNPNAPAFNIGSLFKSKPEKEKEKEVKEKAKADKAEKKEKSKANKEKAKNKEVASTPDALHHPLFDMESPTESRRSRDGGASVQSLHSVSESRDSLSLDQSFSNTPSEPTSAGLSGSFKDEGVVRKLFRKSSSSKFSLPGRLVGNKDTSGGGLFKKGPSSTTSGGASDRGLEHRSSIGDFEDIGDEALNSSSIGRSFDSVTSSPGLGPTKSKEAKTTSARWLNTFKKGRKEKESLDLDRTQTSDLNEVTENNGEGR